MRGGDSGRSSGTGRTRGQLLLVGSFIALLVIGAVSYGVAANRHAALLPRDASDSFHAEVTDYEYVAGEEPTIDVTFDLVNPTRTAVVVERPETVVARIGEERVADLPVTSHEARRLPAGETETRTVTLTLDTDDTERVRAAVADRELRIGGLFAGRVGREGVRLSIVRGVPGDD